MHVALVMGLCSAGVTELCILRPHPQRQKELTEQQSEERAHLYAKPGLCLAKCKSYQGLTFSSKCSVLPEGKCFYSASN